MQIKVVPDNLLRARTDQPMHDLEMIRRQYARFLDKTHARVRIIV